MKTKKEAIKQRIIATIVVVFMFSMIYGAINVQNTGAIGTNTTLTQNFVNGDLAMEAPATVAFNNITLGAAANSLANVAQVNARDYRGTGAAWGVTATMNNLRVDNGEASNISNAVIAWAPGAYFSDNGTNTGVSLGSAGYFSAARTLFNTSATNGMGNYKIVNTTLNVVYSGSTSILAGTYQNTLTMTIQ